MRHFWRKTLLLLAAAALLLTVALAADGAEQTGFRVLNQRETVNVVDTHNPYWSMSTTLNAGTAVRNHVDGAVYYKVGLGIGEELVDEDVVYYNYWDLSEYLGAESEEYFIAYLAIDAEDKPLWDAPQVIFWQYTAPVDQLSQPQIAVNGNVGTVTTPLDHVARYEVEVYDKTEQRIYDIFPVESPNTSFSVPYYIYEWYPSDAYAARLRAISDDPLSYQASVWSDMIELTAPTQLQAPTNVRIIQETEKVEVIENGEPMTRTLYPGSVVWDYMGEEVQYCVEYYRAGETQDDMLMRWSVDSNYLPIEHMEEVLAVTGTYYAMVFAETETPGYRPSEPVRTENWVYSELPPSLPVPTIKVDGNVATISLASDNVLEYEMRLLDQTTGQQLNVYYLNAMYPSFSISEKEIERYPGHAFSIQVSAIAKDPTRNGNSEFSDIVPLKTPERLEPVTDAHFVTTPTSIDVDFGDGTIYEKTLYPGAILWEPVAGATHYLVEVFCDGEPYESYYTVSNFNEQWFHAWEQLPSGTYSAKISAVGDDGAYLPSDPVAVGPWQYTQPDNKCSQPTNLRWDGYRAVADPVEYATLYWLTMFYSETEDGPYQECAIRYSSETPDCIFSDAILKLGNGFYYFEVVAYCSDVTVAVASAPARSTVLSVQKPQLPAPQNVRQAQESTEVTYEYLGDSYTETVNRGVLTWDPVKDVSYYLLRFYDAETTDWILESYVYGAPIWNRFYEGYLTPGETYDVTVQAMGNAEQYVGSECGRLTGWTYTVPEEKLPRPSVSQQGNNLHFEVDDPDCDDYVVQIMCGADRGAVKQFYEKIVPANEIPIPDYILEDLNGNDNYYVRVLARPKDRLAMADSDWSQLVWLTEPESVKETISQVEQIVMDLPDEAELAAVQTELEKMDSDRLLTALEEKPAEMTAQIAALEEKAGVTVTVQDQEAQTSNVQVVGLGLSADDTTRDITLTVARTPHAGLQLLAAPEISGQNFQSAADVTFKAENVKDELVIPVQISLPVSTEDPDQLRLYQGEDLEEVPFILTMENGQTFVKFAVSDLSQTYVLAEANPLGEVTVDHDGTVTVTANAPDGAILYAASYNEDGKMLAVATDTIAAGKTSYILSLTPGAAVQVFLLDENQMPLCQAKII